MTTTTLAGFVLSLPAIDPVLFPIGRLHLLAGIGAIHLDRSAARLVALADGRVAYEPSAAACVGAA